MIYFLTGKIAVEMYESYSMIFLVTKLAKS